MKKQAINEQLAKEAIDVTLPGRPARTGNHHPLTRVVEEIEDFFISMGYEIAEGPEVEKDYYNFEALTCRKVIRHVICKIRFIFRKKFFFVRIRHLFKHGRWRAKDGAPIKIICPGKVYRRDSDDATHSHQFTQIEGLVVGEDIRMSDLKGTLALFAKKMFGDEREIRLRPSFFPFTEPSVEMDISCFKCGGDGCNVCKKTGWIEILGAGMVHPNVLKMAGYDPAVVSGFAFGMGPERIAMLKYGVEDIRHFYTNDVRFVSQFHRTEA